MRINGSFVCHSQSKGMKLAAVHTPNACKCNFCDWRVKLSPHWRVANKTNQVACVCCCVLLSLAPFSWISEPKCGSICWCEEVGCNRPTKGGWGGRYKKIYKKRHFNTKWKVSGDGKQRWDQVTYVQVSSLNLQVSSHFFIGQVKSSHRLYQVESSQVLY